MVTPAATGGSLQTRIMQKDAEEAFTARRSGEERDGDGGRGEAEGAGSGGEGGGGGGKKEGHRLGDIPRRSRKSNRSSGSSSQSQGRGSQKRQNSGRTSSGRSGAKSKQPQKPKDPTPDTFVSKMFDAALAKTGNVGPDGRATFEAKALLTATLATLLGLLLQIVAVSTNSWLLMDFPGQGLYRNSSRSYLVGAYTGLWKLCRVEVFMEPSQDGTFRETKRTECEKQNLFPTEAEIQRNKDYDQHHLDYRINGLIKIDYTRTAIAFTIIAFVMTAIGHSFAFYALRRPRYIIKRLAALLHFMTAACLLVLNEVFVKMVDHEKTNMPERIPKESVTSFGYSFILSWIVFVIFVLAGMVFLLMSHKRKAEYADHEDGQEDEPMQLGRR